jgi:hypothetical protein
MSNTPKKSIGQEMADNYAAKVGEPIDKWPVKTRC